MQNRTEIVGVSLWERLRQLARSHKELMGHLGSLLMGYVLAGSSLFGSVAPFGAAFVAAVPGRFSISGAVGAIIGYTFAGDNPGGMKYIVAVLMIVAARWLFEPKTAGRARVAVLSVAAAVSLGVSSSAVLLFTDATMYDMILSIAELLLIGGSTYFFTRALSAAGLDWSAAGRSDISCVIIALSVTLMGLSTIRIAGFSLGKILAALIVMLCARYAREAGGAISGVTAGFSLALAGGDYSYLLTTFGFGGLISGIFGGMGRIATAASFIFVNTVVSLFTQTYLNIYTSILEVFVASVIFVVIPQSWISSVGLLHQSGVRADTSSQKALCERLGDVSGALKEICATTQQVSQKLGRMEKSSFASVYTHAAEQVCLRCGMKTACWQFRYADTVDAMEKCLTHLKKEGTIAKNQVPRHFADNCCKLDEFTTALDSHFHDFVAREGVQRKVSKVRAVVTDQFEGIALMLDEITGELGAMRLLEPAKAKLVEEYFKSQGVTTKQVHCYTDEYERITLEVHIPGYHTAKVQKTKATLDLCDLLEAEFDLPHITTREQYTSLLFTEKATYTVQTGACQIAAAGGKLCGDAYDVIHNKGGKAHFILSDGMGSGGSAAVDSAMASGLISRLISVGVGYEAALKMVNSALLIKSGEESLATIDICSLDLYTGKAEFYKAGAAPTFVVKGGKAGYVESTSLPAGILRGVAFETSSMTLHEGDLVLLVSDGVIATGSDWVKSELEHTRQKDMQRLCEHIASTARARRADGREDDITVLAIQVQKGV